MLAVLTALFIAQAQAPKVEFLRSDFVAAYGRARSSTEGPLFESMRQISDKFPKSIQLADGRVLKATAGGPKRIVDFYWQQVDAVVFSSKNQAEAVRKLSDSPNKLGGLLDPKEIAPTVGAAIQAAERAYADRERDQDHRSIDIQLQYWKEHVQKRWDAMFREFLVPNLGLSNPPASLRVLVVPSLPDPGAMTIRTEMGPLCIVGIAEFRDADFAEAAIHEMIHSLEANGSCKLLIDLRAVLAQRTDLAPFDRQQFPHALFFMTAAEAIRRFVDNRHADLGDSELIYQKGLVPYRNFADPILSDLWGNRINLDEATKRLGEYRPKPPTGKKGG